MCCCCTAGCHLVEGPSLIYITMAPTQPDPSARSSAPNVQPPPQVQNTQILPRHSQIPVQNPNQKTCVYLQGSSPQTIQPHSPFLSERWGEKLQLLMLLLITWGRDFVPAPLLTFPNYSRSDRLQLLPALSCPSPLSQRTILRNPTSAMFHLTYVPNCIHN